MISNQTRAARSFDFEITRMISDQIALHSVQLPICKLLIPEISESKDGRFFGISSLLLPGGILGYKRDGGGGGGGGSDVFF